ncbi:MICOS complex subunit Mic10-like [Tachypleus tridentatus]|uniref:MICOS complex subunit Mic10-like n=1 Tax=Tachypleus tridentatus TaxID=6853 RepID=UPI003FCF62D3
MTMAKVNRKSEDEVGEKWDHCIADTFIKMGSGLGVGIIFSVLMFKRKTWPLTFGIGAGLGMGISNCQHSLNQPFFSRVQKLKGKPKELPPGSEGQATKISS